MQNYQLLTWQFIELAKAQKNHLNFFVRVDHVHHSNLRWAGSKITTNATGQDAVVTITAFVTAKNGVKTATSQFPAANLSFDQIKAQVEKLFKAASLAKLCKEEAAFAPTTQSKNIKQSADPVTAEVFKNFTPQLASLFANKEQEQFGYAQADYSSIWFATSLGTFLYFETPTGRVELTAKSKDHARSAFEGASTRTFTDFDLTSLSKSLTQQLKWQERRVNLPAGRYETVLPAGAVADMIIPLIETLTLTAAKTGVSALSNGGSKTKLGQSLCNLPLNLFSDPNYPGLEEVNVVQNMYQGQDYSVFDTGLPLSRTNWISNGKLESLVNSRYSAQKYQQPFTPDIDNIILEMPQTDLTLEDLVKNVKDGLLLNTLWYIRSVDEPTLLQTGLTRDGVYQIKNGEVVAGCNNFRFNQSPLTMLKNIKAVSKTIISQPRENAESELSIATPALQVVDFNMSSISESI